MPNSGQFKKNNQAARKKGGKSKTKYFKNSLKNPVVTTKKETDINTYEYLPFGEDNLFPQEQAELYRKSPVARAVINSKRDYVVGEGFSSENEIFNKWTPNIRETKEELSNKILNDRYQNGNQYLEIVKLNGTVIVNHVDSTKCRGSHDRKHVIIHPKWENYRRSVEESVVLPLYPEFAKVDGLAGERSIMHIKDYEPTFSFYGVPSNIAGNDSAEINYRTNRWNLNRIKKGFHTSGLLQLFADFEDEDAKAFSDDFDDAFTGEENAGKPMKVINQTTSERNDTKWIPFTENIEGHWTELHNQAIKEICTANQWFPTLTGISVPSGWDTERIRNEYQIAITTVISAEQTKLIDIFNTIFRDLMNIELDDVQLINKSPFSNIDLIDFTDTVGKNERRAFLGLEPIEEEDVKQSLNGAQVTAMVDVVRAFKVGEISIEAGVRILVTAYGIPEEDAKQFFK